MSSQSECSEVPDLAESRRAEALRLAFQICTTAERVLPLAREFAAFLAGEDRQTSRKQSTYTALLEMMAEKDEVLRLLRAIVARCGAEIQVRWNEEANLLEEFPKLDKWIPA